MSDVSRRRLRRHPAPPGVEFVGDVTRATVPLSKDDYVFSVRAVGRDGERGLAAYPLQLRTPLPAAR